MALMVGTVLKEKKQNHASCDFLNIYQFRKKSSCPIFSKSIVHLADYQLSTEVKLDWLSQLN